MIRALRKVNSVGWGLIVLMLWLYGGGRVYAENYASRANRAAPVAREGSRFDSLLSELKGLIAGEGTKTKRAPEKGFAGIRKLDELKESVAREHEKNHEYFSQLESFMKQKRLPAEILSRHQEFVRDYTVKYEALVERIEAIESAHADATGLWGRITGKNKNVDWEGVLGKASSFLEANLARPRKSQFDPKNLPHRSLRADQPIPPKLTRDEWLKAFPKESSSAKGQDSIILAASAPPTPADLAETIEVKFTPEIRQLADSLGRNPVKIFNWVRNNIEFIPTWGSIQGAQLCLETRAGNAFDTASLLIALLRYSGIPARYQMGTIEVPIEKAKNWLGGFTDPRAAASLAASGGIPSAGTVEQGGVLRSIRMEHVWVRAYVDYAPSQAEVNVIGDTWVDLDPSFKLYDRQNDQTLASALGFDVNSFRQQLAATTQIDIAGGVVNVDANLVGNAFTNLLSGLETLIPSGDLSDKFTQSPIAMRQLPVLSARLGYTVLARAPSMAALPSAVQHVFSLALTNDAGVNSLSFSAPLPHIACNSISLVYAPATDADLNLIRSVAPPNLDSLAPASVIQAIMSSVPAYLVKVRPIIQLDGVDAVSGAPVQMGTTLTLKAHFSAPTIYTADPILSTVAWGRYGITLDLAGISTETLTKRDAAYDQMVSKFQGQPLNGVAPLSSLARDLIILGWFYHVDRQSRAMSRAYGAAWARYPSLGFSYATGPLSEMFGSPVRLGLDSYVIDIQRQLHIISSVAGDRGSEKGFSFSLGLVSSFLEGFIPAVVFTGRSGNIRGISATSALFAAAEQDIPIRAIDANNASTLLPLIDQGYHKEFIADAAASGKSVFVPERPPLIDGARVFAYVALEPETNDGAYVVANALGGWLTAICPDNATEFHECSGWLVTVVDILWYVGLAALAIAAFAVLFVPIVAVSGTVLSIFDLIVVAGFAFWEIILPALINILLVALPSIAESVLLQNMILGAILLLVCILAGGEGCFSQLRPLRFR
jgi:transglutaminase-like putative cysteine protease